MANFIEHLFRRLRWDELDLSYLRRHIDNARDEDLAGLGLAQRPARPGDPTTELTPGNKKIARARLVARRDCVVCGMALTPLVLQSYLEHNNGGKTGGAFYAEDGAHVSTGTTLAVLEGETNVLLQAERVLLNYLQKLTGIATLTATYAEKLIGTQSRLLDTRKTTPGWRMLEKYAVATGGGWNHRLGLFDRIMLKDNHLAAGNATAGERLAALVRTAKEARPDLAVECEVDSLEQVPPVLDAGADIIMLDNFSVSGLRAALALTHGRTWTEVSGGVTLTNLVEVARLGADFISTGALTHQAKWVDIGLDWE
jgi:nicotinate-nucleotide pyrophosphorylase (carboxylating)